MASCPNCGFDLDVNGHCAVCGSGPARSGQIKTEGTLAGGERRPAGGQKSGAGSSAPEEGERGPGAGGSGSLLLIIGAAAVLIVLAGVGYFVLRDSGRVPAASGRTPQTRAVSVHASSSVPAVGGPTSAPMANAASTTGGRTTRRDSPVTISRVGFSAPVGASPVGIRATHPIDLYNPARQPVFDITKRTALPPLSSEHAYVKWMLEHTHQQEKFLRERWIRAMKAVDRHLLVHRRVLMAFLLTPREWFVRSYNLPKTYENTALPIGYGQTISGPDLVAHMTDALDPQPDQRVLEIGTGSGYQSAVLSQLSNYVYTIEIVKPLAEQTNQIYLEHTKAMPEYANIHRRLADGYYGWPAYAPFDRIIVTTGIDHIPPDLLKELKPGGIMVIPIGPPTGQTILKITKTIDKAGRIHLARQNLYPGVRDIFVPFTASGGGTHDTRNRTK